MRKRLLAAVKKFFCVIGFILFTLLIAVASTICLSIQWMFDTWNNLTIDELVFHLKAPLEGTNEGMIREYLSVCIVPSILLILMFFILFITSKKGKRFFVVMGFVVVGSLGIVSINVHNAWNQLGVGNYVKNQGKYSTFIDDYYVDPADVEIVFPEKKRNLIYIFLESMEITYTNQENGGAFKENVIPELTKLAEENEDFSGEDEKLNGGYSATGTTWTMGAMFAQTSGLPLNIPISANDMGTQDSFFSGILTLGDILEEEGYSQSLIVGSDAQFGGRALYFTEHGKYDIMDHIYLLEHGMLPQGYAVWWGYEDQKLFEFAKERVLELADREEPFNLTLLTADTHFEDGYFCQLCKEEYEEQYSNVMACSSYQVSKFVEWIQKQDFFENTTIVLVGDHPTMDSDFCEGIDSGYVRKVYTSFINSAVDVQGKTRRDYTTFDMFPTTLASLGVQIEGDRLGLGTNLFSTMQTLIERVGIETEEKELRKKSKLLEQTGNIDKNSKDISGENGHITDPIAEVMVGDYDYTVGELPVIVTNIENIENEIQTVAISVWTNEDQSDLQWIQLDESEKGMYCANINIPDFGYKLGEYHILVYVVDRNGNQYMVGEGTGLVE